MHRLEICAHADVKEFLITLYNNLELYSVQFMLALHSIYLQISRVFTRDSASPNIIIVICK